MSNNTLLSNNRFQNKSKKNNYSSENNSFKKINERYHTNKKTEVELSPDLFPALVKQDVSNIHQEQQTHMNFKDIVNSSNQNDIINYNISNNDIYGWVEFYKSNTSNEIVCNNYSKTQIKNNEEDVNELMNNTIELMKQRWIRYKEYYDGVNGEGAYDEKYVLPPIYGSEYDTEEEEEECEYEEDYENEMCIDYYDYEKK